MELLQKKSPRIFEIPLSTVYNILKGLRDAGFIEARRFHKKLGKPSMAMQEEEKRTGKQKRIYVERINWGDFSQMTSEFRTYFRDELEDIVYDDGIIGNYCDLIDKIIMKMKENSDGKDLLPLGETCPKCHFNHEATEFVFALLYAIADTIKYSLDFEEICKKHRYLVYDT